MTGAATVIGIGGFVVAALVFAGPDRLREATPVGALRGVLDGIAGDDHGREATAPREIPLRGWLQVIMRVVLLVSRNRLMQESAAVAFYTLLAIFPALAAIVSIYGLVADPGAIQRLIDALEASFLRLRSAFSTTSLTNSSRTDRAASPSVSS